VLTATHLAAAQPAASPSKDGGDDEFFGPPPSEEPFLGSAEPEQDLGLGGRLFSYVRVPTSDPANDPLQQVSSSAWLQAHPRLGQSTYAHVVGSVDAIATSVLVDENVRGRLREAYVDTSAHGLEVRLGQQIVPWGNADGFNPTDLLSSSDNTLFASDTEVRRLGTPMLWASYTPLEGASPFRFIAVAVPVFTSGRPLVPPDLVPAGVVDEGLDRPEPTLSNAEVAGRISYAGSMWDASVMGFHGWNHIPEYELRSFTATQVNVGRRHRVQDAVGLEASASTGSWVFRLESAYVWTGNANGEDPERQPAHWDSVVGVERPFFERLRVQAQLVFRYHPRLRPLNDVARADPVETVLRREVTKANALLLNYRFQSWPLATLRLAYTTENERFGAEVFGAVQLVRAEGDDVDFVARPQVTWFASDALRWRLGAELFEGPDGGVFGALHAFSGVYTEGEFVF
jgi:Protein of unknown function (DUF1302)